MMTVKENTVGGTLTTSNELCLGENGAIQLSGFLGQVVEWQSSTDNFNNESVSIPINSSEYSFTNILKTTYYRAVVQNPGCAVDYSSPAEIKVNVPTSSVTKMNICNDDLPL